MMELYKIIQDRAKDILSNPQKYKPCNFDLQDVEDFKGISKLYQELDMPFLVKLLEAHELDMYETCQFAVYSDSISSYKKFLEFENIKGMKIFISYLRSLVIQLEFEISSSEILQDVINETYIEILRDVLDKSVASEYMAKQFEIIRIINKLCIAERFSMNFISKESLN